MIRPSGLREKQLLAVAALLAGLGAACATAPLTQRSQLILVSPGYEARLGAQAFEAVSKKGKRSRDPTLATVVERVGRRVAQASGIQAEWEFAVFEDDKTVNAFALPGGKVGVYTGLLPVAETEAGLGAVLAHEVAHVIARHGAERLSQGLLAQFGAAAIQIGMGGNDPVVTRGVLQAYGLGATVGVLLPWGRTQESEADRIGLVLMAKAGYDPYAALSLWERMEKREGRQRAPEFLSTHPGPGHRAENIRAWLPEALPHYRPTAEQAAEGGQALPAIGTTRRAAVPAPPPPTPAIREGRWEREATAGLRFVFALDRPVAIQGAEIRGPEGIIYQVFLEARLEANQREAITLPPEAMPGGVPPAGTYTLTIKGRFPDPAGQPFTAERAYAVR
ncbi:MAG: M48 family metallopeptidase [candidate division NC10 bacterium]|nr:M48 family metallopeptidase [candidate division NC10 bacterium]